MSQLVNEFEYILNQPISIHKGGEMAKVNTLLLKAPTNAHRYFIVKLRQGYSKALMDQQKILMSISNLQEIVDTYKDDARVKEKSNITGSVAIEQLYSSSVDMNDYINTFKDLLFKDICFVDGSIKMNEHIFNQLSIDDVDKVMEMYFENFLLSSWTKH